MALDGRGLPRWPLANTDAEVMLGTSVNIVVGEAYIKGLRGFDESRFYTFSKDALLGREELNFGSPPNLETYDELGYWPEEEHGRSVAWAQEQSIADYSLAQMGLAMEDSTDANILLGRSENWSNLWDEELQWFHGRKRDGTFGELVSEGGEDSEGQCLSVPVACSTIQKALETLGGTERTLERPIRSLTRWKMQILAPGLQNLGTGMLARHPYSLFCTRREPKQPTNGFTDSEQSILSCSRWSCGNDDGGTCPPGMSSPHRPLSACGNRQICVDKTHLGSSRAHTS